MHILLVFFLLLTQLEGVNEPVVLQVFVGNDTGRVKPHGFYQACRVTGRNTTACKEVDVDGTTVIEVSLDPSTNMTLAYVLFARLNLRRFCDKCCSSEEFNFDMLNHKQKQVLLLCAHLYFTDNSNQLLNKVTA